MSVPPQLTGVIAKTLRAEAHFEALHSELIAYLEACRDRTQLPTKISPDKNTIRLTFEPMIAPSLLISMILGDCIHNARSSLDHLWKRLGGDGNFPIFRDTHSSNNWRLNMPKKLNGVPSGAHTIIDRLQPCHDGKNAPVHSLSILNELSNIDKHQAIHVTMPRSKDTRFAFRERDSAVEAYVIRVPVVFHEQTEVFITDIPAGVVKPGVDVNIQGRLFVSFKEPGPWGDEDVRTVLRGCLDFVKNSVIVPLAAFTK
jgi:hypothetical protein